MSYGKLDDKPDYSILQMLWVVLCICVLYSSSIIGCALLYDNTPPVITNTDLEYDPAIDRWLRVRLVKHDGHTFMVLPGSDYYMHAPDCPCTRPTAAD